MTTSLALPFAQYAWNPKEQSWPIDTVSPQMSLWRYVDLTKLVSLLDSSSLFFTRSDLLGDPFEGSITSHRQELRRSSEARQRRAGLPVKLSAHSQAMVETAIVNTIVNCWHMNEYESAAMWRLYLSSSEGVAIRTTYSRLLSSLPKSRAKQQTMKDGWNKVISVRAAVVKYIDFETEKTGLSSPFLYKRASYSHERELRLIAQDDSMQGDPRPSRFPKGGDHVPVRMQKLIEAVYVAPSAPEWFAAVVRSIVVRYGFRFPVWQSALSTRSKSPLH